MKPTSEILERIEKCSSEHKDGVFTRLYRYLLREDIYYAAYQKLYANKGATTQGIDNDTADGFSDFYVKELIQSLKDGTYKANPVRREYIPKKNGKLRPLGIPSFRDKLLQEVVRMILEAIYEPVFDSHSHGFRPGKSCHTALRQISSDFTGVVWFIEGDIQGCFDNINHEKLIDILSRKIKDSRFLNIIRQYKDGKTWSVPYETKAGTKRVRPVKIADCKRGEASDIIYQRKKFSWKTTIRQRLNARVCELCGCKEADLYEVHVIRNLNELGNSDWETVMKKKRRKTLVVCSKCHERIHRH